MKIGQRAILVTALVSALVAVQGTARAQTVTQTFTNIQNLLNNLGNLGIGVSGVSNTVNNSGNVSVGSGSSNVSVTATGASNISNTINNANNSVNNNINSNVNNIENNNENSQEQSQSQTNTNLLPLNLLALTAPHLVGVGSVGGSSLPKTGVDAMEVGGVGTASLLIGGALMEFARRRRRNWNDPVTASQEVATLVGSTVVSTIPEERMPEPVGGEADLLLPYAPQPPEASRPEEPPDIITPSF